MSNSNSPISKSCSGAGENLPWDQETMTAADQAARIDALEAHSAHQDRALTELSDAVAEQWKRIDALTREVLRLRDDVQGLSQRSAPEKPPPHY
jgi:SlyX protein